MENSLTFIKSEDLYNTSYINLKGTVDYTKSKLKRIATLGHYLPSGDIGRMNEPQETLLIGDVYIVAEKMNKRLQFFDKDGSTLGLMNNFPKNNTYSGILSFLNNMNSHSPLSMCFHKGCLIIGFGFAETGINACEFKILNFKNESIKTIDGASDTYGSVGYIDRPWRVAVNNNDEIAYCEELSNVVTILDMNGKVKEAAFVPEHKVAFDIDFNSKGELLALYRDELYCFYNNYELKKTVKLQTNNTKYNGLEHFQVDKNDNIIGVGYGPKLEIFNPSGKLLRGFYESEIPTYKGGLTSYAKINIGHNGEIMISNQNKHNTQVFILED